MDRPRQPRSYYAAKDYLKNLILLILLNKLWCDSVWELCFLLPFFHVLLFCLFTFQSLTPLLPLSHSSSSHVSSRFPLRRCSLTWASLSLGPQVSLGLSTSFLTEAWPSQGPWTSCVCSWLLSYYPSMCYPFTSDIEPSTGKCPIYFSSFMKFSYKLSSTESSSVRQKDSWAPSSWENVAWFEPPPALQKFFHVQKKVFASQLDLFKPTNKCHSSHSIGLGVMLKISLL